MGANHVQHNSRLPSLGQVHNHDFSRAVKNAVWFWALAPEILNTSLKGINFTTVTRP